MDGFQPANHLNREGGSFTLLMKNENEDDDLKKNIKCS